MRLPKATSEDAARRSRKPDAAQAVVIKAGVSQAREWHSNGFANGLTE
jgi:hypothetical protein